MKFIFPKNYNYSFKLFGMLSYSSVIFIFVWAFLVYSISSFLFTSFIIKFYFFILLFIPIALFSILNRSNEHIIFIIFYILKYLYRPKVYFYDKRF